jgi:glutaredoxin
MQDFLFKKLDLFSGEYCCFCHGSSCGMCDIWSGTLFNKTKAVTVDYDSESQKADNEISQDIPEANLIMNSKMRTWSAQDMPPNNRVCIFIREDCTHCRSCCRAFERAGIDMKVIDISSDAAWSEGLHFSAETNPENEIKLPVVMFGASIWWHIVPQKANALAQEIKRRQVDQAALKSANLVSGKKS